jgi:hypothetical protein
MFAWLHVANFWCLASELMRNAASVASWKCSCISDISVLCLHYTFLTATSGRSWVSFIDAKTYEVIKGKGKDKFHPRIGHEGPEGE